MPQRFSLFVSFACKGRCCLSLTASPSLLLRQAGKLPGHWPHVTLALGQGFNLTAFALSLLLVRGGPLDSGSQGRAAQVLCGRNGALPGKHAPRQRCSLQAPPPPFAPLPSSLCRCSAPTPPTTAGGRRASCGAAWSTAHATLSARWVLATSDARPPTGACAGAARPRHSGCLTTPRCPAPPPHPPAAQSLVFFRDEDAHLRELLAKWTIAFPHVLMCHLREHGDVAKAVAVGLLRRSLSSLWLQTVWGASSWPGGHGHGSLHTGAAWLFCCARRQLFNRPSPCPSAPQHILTAEEVAALCSAAHRPNFVLQASAWLGGCV